MNTRTVIVVQEWTALMTDKDIHEDTTFPFPYNEILNMTDEQAASILESVMVNFTYYGRGCGRTQAYLAYSVAFSKAIEKLRGGKNDVQNGDRGT